MTEWVLFPGGAMNECDVRLDVHTAGFFGWAMRMTHVPSGTIVETTSKEFRSQFAARRALWAQLAEKVSASASEISRGQQVTSGEGT